MSVRKKRDSKSSAGDVKQYFLHARKEKPRSKYREALLFFFFNRVTFSGTTRAGGFSSAASQTRFTASSTERLSTMPQALNGTRITSTDFAPVITEPGEDDFIFRWAGFRQAHPTNLPQRHAYFLNLQSLCNS